MLKVWALFAALFAVFAACAYPTIAPRDSADLASAAQTLGVAHPPGYPLYVNLGRAWITLLPFGNNAYRLNLLSAAAGAGACVLLFSSLRRTCGPWAALAAALAFAFSASLWKFSLLEEKYSLQALFAAALLWLGGERTERRLLASGLLLGLGLVNHQTLILLAPALLVLWRGVPGKAAAGLLFFVGLSLFAAVGIRLGDPKLSWAVLTRADYGTMTLSGSYARPLSAPLAAALLGHFASGLVRAVTWPIALLAVIGAPAARSADSRLFRAGLVALLLSGPVFFLLSRFDSSSWAARSVLEPAFIVPSLVVCLWAGWGARSLPAPAALALGLFCLSSHLADAEHRRDFAAFDYVKDLRRFIPPGGAAVVAGDTALFGLRYLEDGTPPPHRTILASVERNPRRWLEQRLTEGPVRVAGLSERMLGDLGLLGNPRFLIPEGPVQAVGSEIPSDPDALWALSIRRPSDSGDSYSRDVRFSYAYSRFLTGRIEENYRRPAETDFRWAALLEPETYRLERVPL